jgi:hypothetical protein
MTPSAAHLLLSHVFTFNLVITIAINPPIHINDESISPMQHQHNPLMSLKEY